MRAHSCGAVWRRSSFATGGRQCGIAGCPRRFQARAWCGTHYARWKRHGDPTYNSRPLWNGDPADRFWPRVNADGVCWEWTGGTKGRGYGAFDSERAHVWAYRRLVGEVPEGLELDHLCRNRRCVNPDHLQPVTPRENTLRSWNPPARNARKTHCLRGHPLAGENLEIYFRPDNGKRMRICRQCKRDREAARSTGSRRAGAMEVNA